MNKQETLEEIKVIKRTELYNSILSIVKQIPRKEVECDAIDTPSCAYELEQLFLKWQQEISYSEEDMRKAIQETITLMRYKATEFREHENTILKQFKKK